MTTDRVRGRDPWQGFAWLAVAVLTPAFFVGTHAAFLSRAQQFRVALAFGTIGLVLWVVDARRGRSRDQEEGTDRPFTIAYMALTFAVAAMAILWDPMGPPAWFVAASLLPAMPGAVGGVADPAMTDRAPRRSMHRVATLGSLISGPQPVRIDMQTEQEAEFQQLMDAWSEAIVADDPEAIGGFTEPDWVLNGENGPFPRDRFLELVRNGRITHHTMSHEIHAIRLYGDVAVLLMRGRNTGAYDGQEFELDEWITDVFVHRHNGWRCVVTHLTDATDPALEGPEEEAAVG